MKPSINQIYIENLRHLEDCFKDNPLNPLLIGILSGVKARLNYYEELLTPLEGQSFTVSDIVEASTNLADDLKKVTENYNGLLKRHAVLTKDNEELYNKVKELQNELQNAMVESIKMK